MAQIVLSGRSQLIESSLGITGAPTAAQKRTLYSGMLSLAEDCAALGQTQTAADILAFLLLQPEMSADDMETARELFAELESRVCPRVILDAREFAFGMDLRTMLEYLLDLIQRERS